MEFKKIDMPILAHRFVHPQDKVGPIFEQVPEVLKIGQHVQQGR